MPVAKDRLGSLQVCKLIQCVRERSKAQIDKLVQCGIPYLVNYGEPYEGETALIIAVKENDIDMIKFLTKSMGALPDFGDLAGVTPAMRAAERGLDGALAALIEVGANMRASDNEGKSILFYCLEPSEEHAKCLALALENDADVNWPAKDGRTAFFAACEVAADNPEACKRLLEAGAMAEVAQVGNRRTALMAACASGSDEVVLAALLRGADPNSADRQGGTPAHHAARAGHLGCLFRLSAFGADFDRLDAKQNGAIHLATAAGHAGCVKFLGQRGTSAAKVKNADGKTLRLLAKEAKVSKACTKEVRRAERMSGKPRAKNNELWALTLYDWTLARGEELRTRLLAEFDPESTGQVAREDFVQVLGIIGAPWTPDCDKKLGPLYDKTKNGSFDYKDFLLGKKYIGKLYLAAAFEPKKKRAKKGKGGGRRKKKAKYPFDICVLPDEQVMRPAYGAPPVMYVPRAVSLTDTQQHQQRFEEQQLQRMPELYQLEKQAELSRPQASRTLQDDSVWYSTRLAKSFVNLNDCAKHGDVESIRLALRKGYGTEVADKLSKTPLMVAAHYGNIDVAKFLLEAGADVAARDNFKWTPLHHACHAGHLEMAELLLKSGAPTEAVALNGSTPLLRAIETANLQLVDLLLKYGAEASVENKMGQMIHEVAQNWGAPKVADFIKTKFPKMTAIDPKKRKTGGGAKRKR